MFEMKLCFNDIVNLLVSLCVQMAQSSDFTLSSYVISKHTVNIYDAITNFHIIVAYLNLMYMLFDIHVDMSLTTYNVRLPVYFRPPGHHAMKEEFNGYCYLNNVAVSAKLALDNHNLKR